MGPTLPLTTLIYWRCIAGSLSTGLYVHESWFTPCYLSECQLAWTSPSQPQTAGFPAVPSQPHSSKPNMEKRSSKAATMVHGTHHLLPYHHRHPTTCSHTFPILCSLHILLRNRNSVPHEWTCIVLCKFFLKWMETYFPSGKTIVYVKTMAMEVHQTCTELHSCNTGT